MAITAQDVSFTPTTWADGSEGGTPITAEQLNRVETGVNDLATQHNALVGDVQSLQDYVSEWSSAAVDGTYFTSGLISYLRLGSVLLVQFNGVILSKNITTSDNGIVLATGFPSVSTNSSVIYNYSSSPQFIRVSVSNGNLIANYPIAANAVANQFYGLVALTIA